MSSNLAGCLYFIPFFGALFATAFGLFIKGSARLFTLLSLTALSVASIYGCITVYSQGTLRTELGGWIPPLGIELVLDMFAALVSVLLSVTSLIIISASKDSIRRELQGRQTLFYATSLLLIAGLMGLILAGDLFNLFVHLEVASLCACALVASGGKGAPEAGLRYLILGSLGASLYLLGVGFLYAAVGSLNMSDVALRLITEQPDQRLIVISLTLILVGLSVKIGIFPLHGWMPSAYSKAPLVAAALMAPLVTKISAFALFRILFYVFGAEYLRDEFVITECLLWGGSLGMVVGGLLAFKQNNIRIMLAYSSVAQIGLVAIGFGFASATGMIGALLHIANDALMKAALFLAASALLLRYKISNVNQLKKIRYQAPWLAAVITISGLSLIGMPPLAGFFGKWYVLSASIEAGRADIATMIVLGSLTSVAYVFKLLEQIYFTPPVSEEGLQVSKKANGEIVAAIIFTLAIILFGLLSSYIVSGLLVPSLLEQFLRSI
jgi:multicomponent Na+:H+ antiporter subunit D